MKYSIGTIARHVGLTKGSIRNYEKMELIQSERDKDNNYRYYDMADIDTLIKIRSFRSIGFSLQEIKGIMNNCDICTIQNSMSKKSEELRDEINKIQDQLNSILKVEKKLKKIIIKPKECIIATQPELLWLPIIEGKETDNSWKEIEMEWASNMPDVAISPIFVYEEGKIRNKFGFSIEANSRLANRLPKRQDIKILPSVKSAYGIVGYHRIDNDYCDYDDFEDILNSAKNMGASLANEIPARGLFTINDRDNTEIFYAEIWLPL